VPGAGQPPGPGSLNDVSRASVCALPLAVLALAGCGSSASSSSSGAKTSSSASSAKTQTGSSGASAAGSEVKMQGLAFAPATLHGKVGQTVVFVNDDQPAHNVTYVSGVKFASSSTINPGGKFSLKLTQAGTIHYTCTIHPFMKGTIVVTK
jgi:plastocyanin